ncbi:MAG: hypothetical protein AAFY26_19270 [Cyanobacteria bacterium J06638_22]
MLHLVNGSLLTTKDFTPPDARGGIYLHPDGLKIFLKRGFNLLTEVTPPHSGYKVNYRRCMELQVWEYIGCLVGDRAHYRPMRWQF